MKKDLNRKRTCYIEAKNELNPHHLNLFFEKLLQKGFTHFYFTYYEKDSPIVDFLIKLSHIHTNIKIFIVHDSKIPFWQKPEFYNLPILVDKNNSFYNLKNWLKKYCELIINHIDID